MNEYDERERNLKKFNYLGIVKKILIDVMSISSFVDDEDKEDTREALRKLRAKLNQLEGIVNGY